MNDVVDTLRPLGVRHVDMTATPPRVLRVGAVPVESLRDLAPDLEVPAGAS